MSFTSTKNTGNDFPLCLSSAQHSSLGGGAGVWEEIIKELGLWLRAHLHRGGSWHIFAETLKCPSSGGSNCGAMTAGGQWLSGTQWSWVQSSEPEHPWEAAAPAAPTKPLVLLRRELLPHTARHRHVVSWLLGRKGLLGFLPAQLYSISEKKNTVLNGYLEGLLTQYFSANVAVTLRLLYDPNRGLW